SNRRTVVSSDLPPQISFTTSSATRSISPPSSLPPPTSPAAKTPSRLFPPAPLAPSGHAVDDLDAARSAGDLRDLPRIRFASPIRLRRHAHNDPLAERDPVTREPPDHARAHDPRFVVPFEIE